MPRPCIFVLLLVLVGCEQQQSSEPPAPRPPAPGNEQAQPTPEPRAPSATATPAGDLTEKEAAAEFHKSMAMLNELANQAGDRAASSREKSERQTELLEQIIDRVQAHIRKGEYDDAELLLVDIEWTPVEPGTNTDRERKAQYDRKREELRAIIERRSKGTSNP